MSDRAPEGQRATYAAYGCTLVRLICRIEMRGAIDAALALVFFGPFGIVVGCRSNGFSGS